MVIFPVGITFKPVRVFVLSAIYNRGFLDDHHLLFERFTLTSQQTARNRGDREIGRLDEDPCNLQLAIPFRGDTCDLEGLSQVLQVEVRHTCLAEGNCISTQCVENCIVNLKIILFSAIWAT